jgi:UDP-N-acetyl-D-glucosamine/UDP-N-acetyl-D-galactosamine dehydrogenase
MKNSNFLNDPKIGIIGLGYVGLPLALEFGKKFHTTGFDINLSRIQELLDGIDSTKEAKKLDFKLASKLTFTASLKGIKNCNIFIVTVPTPFDISNKPDLRPLEGACNAIGPYIQKDSIIIFESTVFPGCTEEFCVPLLEKKSGLIFNKDFFCGYSPERINPGDHARGVRDIVKVTSGSNAASARYIDWLYNCIIDAGTFKASSIKVAEAAKVIENTQRDINIALMNELAIIFEKMDIKTHDVLKAAGSKWNFLNFYPGLVGGHCIGVDPYYLTYKAESLGYHPEVILAGRRINDSLSSYIATRIVKLLGDSGKKFSDLSSLVLGATFKENCPDIRNSKVFDLLDHLNNFGIHADLVDPLASKIAVQSSYGRTVLKTIPKNKKYDLVILAVSHSKFEELDNLSFQTKHLKKKYIIFDIKGFFKNIKVSSTL